MTRTGKLCLAVALLRLSAWPQSTAYPLITTVAGDGQPAFAGDGGPALQASLQNPYALIPDRARNLYIADYNNHRIRRVAPDGVITTVAGTGTAGFSGDNGPATAAQLNRPYGLALDAAGNLYIADSYNHRIRRVTPAGVITTVAGTGTAGYSGDNGPASSARLYYPYGITLDAAANLYIGENGNNRVRKVTPEGVITTAAGTGVNGFSGDGGPSTSAQLSNPMGVEVDPTGNLYIADYGNHRVRRVGTDGVISTMAGSGVRGYGGDGGPAASAQMDNPRSLALDGAGNLYIADTGNECIRRVTRAGTISTLAGRAWYGFSGDGGSASQAKLSAVRGVAVDAAGEVYIADTFNHRIRRVISSATGGPLTIITAFSLPGGTAGVAYSATLAAAGGATPYRWSLVSGELPPGLSLDASAGTLRGTPARAGNFALTLRVTDSAGTAVTKPFAITLSWRASTGVISTVAGSGVRGYAGDGGPATAARLNYPYEVVTDAAGNLYIGDYWNHRIRKVTRDGLISTVAGTGEQGFEGDGGPATAAQLNGPNGITLDAQGNLYVSDQRNQRIRKIDSAGVITTVAGNGLQGFAGDGGPATSAQLSTPGSLAVDAAGNLLITDYGNSRIRKVTPEGIITTVAGSGTAGFAGDGGPATAAQLNGPSGLAADAAGNLYLADYANHRVRRVSAAGVITTVAGNGTVGFAGDGEAALLAALAYPCQVAVDAAGNLYITDRDNHRIRKVAPGGIITTVAGNGSPGSTGDAGLGTSAQLDSPMGVAVDAQGNLFIGEGGGHRIRKVVLAPEPLAISTPAALPPTSVGTAYSLILAPAGGTPPYGWSLSSGALPPGVSLETSTGTLSGVPSAVGNFSFELRLADSAGWTTRRTFTLTVTAPVTPSRTALFFTYQTGDPLPAAQTIALSSSGSAASFTVSVSSGADWLSVTPTSGTTPATLSFSVNPSKATLGVQTATITITSGTVRQTITVELAVYSPSGPPQIAASGIVHGATLSTGPVAPGEIVTFFGVNLGPPTLVLSRLDESGQVATRLSDVQVLFDNLPAPLLYVQERQLSAIVPYAVAGTRETQVQVLYRGARSSTAKVPVTASAPGIFTADSTGRGQGSVLNQDYSVNLMANPAEKGSVVSIYATGEGETDPQVADGRLATPQVLPRPKLPVEVTIGGMRAEVLYAGAAPGLVVGLLQVNARVPANVASGSAVPVILTIGTASSPPGVTLAVR